MPKSRPPRCRFETRARKWIATRMRAPASRPRTTRRSSSARIDTAREAGTLVGRQTRAVFPCVTDYGRQTGTPVGAPFTVYGRIPVRIPYVRSTSEYLLDRLWQRRYPIVGIPWNPFRPYMVNDRYPFGYPLVGHCLPLRPPAALRDSRPRANPSAAGTRSWTSARLRSA